MVTVFILISLDVFRAKMLRQPAITAKKSGEAGEEKMDHECTLMNTNGRGGWSDSANGIPIKSMRRQSDQGELVRRSHRLKAPGIKREDVSHFGLSKRRVVSQIFNAFSNGMKPFEILCASEFPLIREKILEDRVRFYRHLRAEDQRELKGYIRWFIASKQFEGCDGLAITDEIRVTVAAQACLLLLHRETPCYERLRLIRVYPGEHFAISSQSSISGECWLQGIILLAWDSVRLGAANRRDGDNVAFHEFAHQLDYEDGKSDGTPLLGRGMDPSDALGAYASWARVLAKEHASLQLDIKSGTKTVMDSYGASDPAEFFAVATECFFEKPIDMRHKHPELYAALQGFYQQDPAAWPT